MLERLGNLALAAASTAVLLLLIDFALSPFLITHVPLKLQAALPRGARLLAQSSKAGAVPHDWIAMLGDSYAQGAGDWLLEVDANRNPPFHSAHLIQEATQRDVMSFGASGAGSLRALVTEPIAGLDLLRRTALFAPADPDVFVFYFYEGNDVEDNVLDLEQRFDARFGRAHLRDPEVFERFLTDVVIAESPLGVDAANFHWWDNLFLTRAVIRAVGALVLQQWPDDRAHDDWSVHEVNRARIAGAVVPLPDGLQAPALNLDEGQFEDGLTVFEQAFRYFRERFAQIPALVVYIPSPLTSYRIVSDRVSVQDERGGGTATFDRDELARRSDRICARVSRAARAAGAGFVDARIALWPLADAQFVHGPRDWKHLNRAGQQAMVDLVAPRIFAGASDDAGCVSVREHFGAAQGAQGS
jgi:hypothetical protein